MKKEWRIHALVLAVLAVMSVAWLHNVYWKNSPESLQAFANRFVQQESLNWQVDEQAEVAIEQDRMKLSWSSGTEGVKAETSIQPLEPCQNLLLSVDIGGTQNAIKDHRWGFRAWLELRTLKGEQVIDSETAEIPLGAETGRERVYGVQARADGADGYQVALIVEPLDGTREAGRMEISHWEVYAK